MRTIAQHLDEVTEINTEKGWREDNASIADLVALLQTETAEASDAWRKHGLDDATTPVCGKAANTGTACPEHGPSKPEGVGSELADFYIRILDTAGRLNVKPRNDNLLLVQIPTYSRGGEPYAATPPVTFTEHMAWLTRLADRLWRRDGEVHPQLPAQLYRLIAATVTVAGRFNINIDAEYERKTAYNRTRPYRHGGKRL